MCWVVLRSMMKTMWWVVPYAYVGSIHRLCTRFYVCVFICGSMVLYEEEYFFVY